MLIADYRAVELSLDNLGRRRGVLAASIVIALVVCYAAGRIWLADARVHSQIVAIIERGVSLEPGNGDSWDRLGRYHQWDFANPDINRAISDFSRAVRDDPNSAHFLMDLAGAYEAAGDNSRAQQTWNRARHVYPASAEVDWNYGNFLLRQGQFTEGYAQIQRAVRGDSSLLPLAISRTWRSSQDVNQLMNQVLPPDVNSYFQALDFFSSIHRADQGLLIWARLVEMRKPLTLDRSFPFLEELIREDRAQDAAEVWRQALAAAGLPHSEPFHSSLVWNGDFSRDFTNGGLGWRWDNPVGAGIDFDSAPSGYGQRSVRIDFTGGENIYLDQPKEYVPVEPNRTYHFRGYLRTETISTESGVRFLLLDPSHPNDVHVMTDNLTGTQPWSAAEADVTTGPQTHFLLLSLHRAQSRLFDNKLSGTVWIADVSLTPITEAPEKSAQ